MSRSIVERLAPIVRVVAEAAASDPEIAPVMEQVKAARRQEMADAATILAGPNRLRIDKEEAAATLYVLYGPQFADMLMSDYGWGPTNTRHGWRACSFTPSSTRPHSPNTSM